MTSVCPCGCFWCSVIVLGSIVFTGLLELFGLRSLLVVVHSVFDLSGSVLLVVCSSLFADQHLLYCCM